MSAKNPKYTYNIWTRPKGLKPNEYPKLSAHNGFTLKSSFNSQKYGDLQTPEHRMKYLNDDSVFDIEEITNNKTGAVEFSCSCSLLDLEQFKLERAGISYRYIPSQENTDCLILSEEPKNYFSTNFLIRLTSTETYTREEWCQMLVSADAAYDALNALPDAERDFSVLCYPGGTSGLDKAKTAFIYGKKYFRLRYMTVKHGIHACFDLPLYLPQ